MFGMLISGWLTDRVNRVALLASIFFVRGLSFVLLLNVGANYQTLAIFAVIFGLADYSTVPVTCRSRVWAHLRRPCRRCGPGCNPRRPAVFRNR
jgi:predicted MFS family arabinose efflux permease